jgi:hypothetical protein
MNDEEFEQLKEVLRGHGYALVGITHFKYFDRIAFKDKYCKISINLRGKLSELSLKRIVEACLGSIGEKVET